ncbi:MAG: hypothetical protein N2748_06660 [candidate division WOR-3 bacterium]|nr:hypothetical protein [candidate division WOR-3 bacterium]
MLHRIILFSYLLGLINLSISRVLLTNGDFEQELKAGWILTFVDPTYGDTIDCLQKFDPDPDYEVRVKKHHATLAKIHQTVNIPTTDLQFSVSTKLYAYEHPSPLTYYWSASAIALRYLDDNYNLLGETRLTNKSLHCPWTNSPTVHLINVTDTINWHTYSFNLNTELNNLPGVNRNNIKKIQIALLDTTNGC